MDRASAQGLLAGIGAITPGLSGGVLLVVLIYEPWCAGWRTFATNSSSICSFLPVGIGGVIGVIAFSAVIDFAFEHYAAQFTWLFIGFIAGTIPSCSKPLAKRAAKLALGIVSPDCGRHLLPDALDGDDPHR